MNRTLLLVLLLAFCLPSFGQKIRFSDTSNKWKWFDFICFDESMGAFHHDKYDGDTTVHGISYRKLYRNTTLKALIREDTITNKVYTIAVYDTDASEHLLYDYTLAIGDTFRCHGYSHYVHEIDSVIINAVWHKYWILFPATVMDGNPYNVIEGVGSTEQPLFPLSPELFERCNVLCCFQNNGSTPAMSAKVGYYFDNSTSCSLTFGLATNNTAPAGNKASISPNPMDETGRLTLNHTIISGSLVIYNSLGQTIINTLFEHKKELLIGDKIKVPGMYYYRLTDADNGVSLSGKFVH